jgi:hypothetical protein
MVAIEKGILYNEKDIDYDAGAYDGAFGWMYRRRQG